MSVFFFNKAAIALSVFKRRPTSTAHHSAAHHRGRVPSVARSWIISSRSIKSMLAISSICSLNIFVKTALCSSVIPRGTRSRTAAVPSLSWAERIEIEMIRRAVKGTAVLCRFNDFRFASEKFDITMKSIYKFIPRQQQRFRTPSLPIIK